MPVAARRSCCCCVSSPYCGRRCVRHRCPRPWPHGACRGTSATMMFMRIACFIMLGILGALLGGCGGSSHTADSANAGERVVNVYNWYDYIKPEVLRQFQTQ